MCSDPLTVGGGVSIEKISSRVLERSNRYVPSASQRVDHFSSSPSRLGFSGAGIPEVYEAGAGAGEAESPRRRGADSRVVGGEHLALALGAEGRAHHEPQDDRHHELGDAGELLLVEHEDLRDEDVEQHAALEPDVPLDSRTAQADGADHDEHAGHRAGHHRRPLAEALDLRVVERDGDHRDHRRDRQEDEDDADGAGEPRPLGEPAVPVTDPLGAPLPSPGLARRERRHVAEQRVDVVSDDAGGFGDVEEGDRLTPARLVELPDRRRLHRLQGVQHRLVGPEGAAGDAAEHQVHRDEHDVDERDRRLEEVVHVLGDELPQLVDEPPEARTAEERDERPGERGQERDRDDDRDRHHQRAPDRVRDVQRAVAELRVAGDDQERPVAEHGRDRAHQEDVEVTRRVDRPQRELPGPCAIGRFWHRRQGTPDHVAPDERTGVAEGGYDPA